MTDAHEPPRPQSAPGAALTENMQNGGLVLQVCEDCNTVQYPPRERCRACLGENLAWREMNNVGRVIAVTALHHSLEPFFQNKPPTRLASVRLKGAVTMIAFCEGPIVAGADVKIIAENTKNHFGFKARAISQEKEQ